MFCTSCGVKNAADSNFCKQCGGKLARPAAKITEDAFDRALPDEEQTVALLERAYRLRRAGDTDAAIALCEEALRLRADSTASHSLLGQLYEEKGDNAAAIHEYERVLALNPGSIADRVQLDELRARQAAGETGPRSAVPAEGASRARARVQLGDHRSAPVFDAGRFTSAGVALALLTLGGLVALQLRPHTPAAPDTPITPSFTKTAQSAASAQSVPNAALANASSAIPSSVSAATPQTAKDASPPAAEGTTVGKNAALPAVSNMTGAAQTTSALPAAPAVNYQRGPVQVRYIRVPAQAASLGVAAVNTMSRLPGRNLRPGGRPTGANDNSRVILDPDLTESNGKIIVSVGDGDMMGKASGGSGKAAERTGDQSSGNTSEKSVSRGSDRAQNNGENTSGMSAHIEMEKPSRGASRNASSPSSSEARSFVAMGEDKKRAKDYRGAIETFTRALGSAGDQSGYIYQQRALCYQYLNDTSSARTDYSRAIEEYRKLEARDPETARNGIRACQSGIKTCGE